MPAIPKNVSQSFSVELRDIFGNLDTATTGAPTINLCKDGTWATAANAATNTKAGYWTVTLTQAETNYREIIVEAVKSGFVTWSRTFYPEPDYTSTKAGYLDENISAAKVLATSQPNYAPSKAGDAMALTSGERTTLAGVIWNSLTSGMTTVGSIGKKLADWVVGTIDTYTGNTKQTGDNYALANGATGFAAIAGYIDTEVAAIKAKTDLIPSSPAAVGSAMTLANDALTAAAIATDAGVELANALLNLANGIETGVTPKQAMQIWAAFSGGDGHGFDGSTPSFDALGNSGTVRITSSVSSTGRTITLHF